MFGETVERNWDAQDEMSTQHPIQYTGFHVHNGGTIIMKVQSLGSFYSLLTIGLVGPGIKY